MTTLICDFQSIVGKKIKGYATLTAGQTRPAYDAPSVVVHDPIEKEVVKGRAVFENVNPGDAVITVDWEDQSSTIRFVVPNSEEDVYLSDCLTGDYFTPEEIDLLRWGIQEQISGARELIESTANEGMDGITGSIADYFTQAAETYRQTLEAANKAEAALGTIDEKVSNTEAIIPALEQTVIELAELKSKVQEGSGKIVNAFELLELLQGLTDSALAEAGAAKADTETLATEQAATLEEIGRIQADISAATSETSALSESLSQQATTTATKIQEVVDALANSNTTYEEGLARFAEAESQMQTLGHQYADAIERVAQANQKLEEHTTQLADLALTAQTAYDALPGLRLDIKTLTGDLNTATGGLSEKTDDLLGKVSALDTLTKQQGTAITSAKQTADKGVSDAATALSKANTVNTRVTTEVGTLNTKLATAKTEAANAATAAQTAAEKYAKEKSEADKAAAEAAAATEALRVAKAEAAAAKKAAASDAASKAAAAEAAAKAHAEAKATAAKEAAEATAAADAKAKADAAKIAAEGTAKTLADAAKSAAAAALNTYKGLNDPKVTKAQQDAAKGIADAKAANDKLPAINQAISTIQEVQVGLETKAQQGIDDAKAANEAVTNIQVGGRNLLGDSKKERGGRRFHEILVWQDIGDYVGEQVTVSAEFKGAGSGEISLYPYQSHGLTVNGTARAALTEDWTRVSWQGTVFDFGDTTPNRTKGGIAVYGTTADTAIHSRRWKIERGNLPTDWTPSPEDTKKDTDALQNDVLQAHQDILVEQGRINTLNGQFQTQQTQINENNSAFQTWQREVNARRDIWEQASTEATKALADLAIEQGKVLAIQQELTAKRDKWESGATLAIKHLTGFATEQAKWNKASANATKALQDAGKAQEDINNLDAEINEAQNEAIRSLQNAIALANPGVDILPKNPETGHPHWADSLTPREDPDLGVTFYGGINGAASQRAKRGIQQYDSMQLTYQATILVRRTAGTNNELSLRIRKMDGTEITPRHYHGSAWDEAKSLTNADRGTIFINPGSTDQIVEVSGFSGFVVTFDLDPHTNRGDFQWTPTFTTNGASNRFEANIRLEAIPTHTLNAVNALNKATVAQSILNRNQEKWNEAAAKAITANTTALAAKSILDANQNRWIQGANLAINNLQTFAADQARWNQAAKDASNVLFDITNEQGTMIQANKDLAAEISDLVIKQEDQLDMLRAVQEESATEVTRAFVAAKYGTNSGSELDDYIQIRKPSNSSGGYAVDARGQTWLGTMMISWIYSNGVPGTRTEKLSPTNSRTFVIPRRPGTDHSVDLAYLRVDYRVDKATQGRDAVSFSNKITVPIGWAELSGTRFVAPESAEYIISFSIDWVNTTRSGKTYGLRIRKGTTPVKTLTQDNIGPNFPWEDGRRTQRITWKGRVEKNQTIYFDSCSDRRSTSNSYPTTDQRAVDNRSRIITWMRGEI